MLGFPVSDGTVTVFPFPRLGLFKHTNLTL